MSYRNLSEDVNCEKGVHSVCTRMSVCDLQSKSHTQVFRLLINSWLADVSYVVLMFRLD